MIVKAVHSSYNNSIYDKSNSYTDGNSWEYNQKRTPFFCLAGHKLLASLDVKFKNTHDDQLAKQLPKIDQYIVKGRTK